MPLRVCASSGYVPGSGGGHGGGSNKLSHVGFHYGMPPTNGKVLRVKFQDT